MNISVVFVFFFDYNPSTITNAAQYGYFLGNAECFGQKIFVFE